MTKSQSDVFHRLEDNSTQELLRNQIGSTRNVSSISEFHKFVADGDLSDDTLWAVYHMGDLAKDRKIDDDLDALAEEILLYAAVHRVRLVQVRAAEQIIYLAKTVNPR